ncbi:MAG: hypothetical protein KGH59_04710, partial [Candidatus Micrarchaeota archaeon]|nr:hypothetical protein [Candidatus Micrarchaeota archaeon]
ILIIAIVTGILCAIRKSTNTRLVFAGAALILIGIVAWLYGDYSGGNLQYVYGGIAASILGIIVWIAGDAMAGMFANTRSKAAMLTIGGIVLLIIGILLWTYADFYAFGNPIYVWGGVALMIIGTIVWLLGDNSAGAFKK